MFRIGTQELLLVLALALLIFGPTKLPKLGKAMGQTIGNFRVLGYADMLEIYRLANH